MHRNGAQVVVRVLKIGFGRRQLFAQGVELAFRIPRIHARLTAYHGGYGRLRITAELRRREWFVNAKRVYRLLREDTQSGFSIRW